MKPKNQGMGSLGTSSPNRPSTPSNKGKRRRNSPIRSWCTSTVGSRSSVDSSSPCSISDIRTHHTSFAHNGPRPLTAGHPAATHRAERRRSFASRCRSASRASTSITGAVGGSPVRFERPRRLHPPQQQPSALYATCPPAVGPRRRATSRMVLGAMTRPEVEIAPRQDPNTTPIRPQYDPNTTPIRPPSDLGRLAGVLLALPGSNSLPSRCRPPTMGLCQALPSQSAKARLT